MDPKLDIKNIIDKAHASRSLLLNKSLHLSKTSVKEDDLTPEKEPHIRSQLAVIAKQSALHLRATQPGCFNTHGACESKEWKGVVRVTSEVLLPSPLHTVYLINMAATAWLCT